MQMEVPDDLILADLYPRRALIRDQRARLARAPERPAEPSVHRELSHGWYLRERARLIPRVELARDLQRTSTTSILLSLDTRRNGAQSAEAPGVLAQHLGLRAWLNGRTATWTATSLPRYGHS